LAPEVCGLGSVTRDTGLFAGQDFLTFEVTPIRNDVQVIAAQRGFRRLRHRRPLLQKTLMAARK